MPKLALHTAFAATLVALTALPIAQAQDTQAQPAAQPAPADPRDPDGDKRISWDEYSNTMAAGFERMDANKDNVLESAELPNQPDAANLTRADFDAKLRESFDRLDADKDGYLAGAEVPAKK